MRSRGIENSILQSREGYRPIARRAAVMFDVSRVMSKINAAYQTSLSQFLLVFDAAITHSERYALTIRYAQSRNLVPRAWVTLGQQPRVTQYRLWVRDCGSWLKKTKGRTIFEGRGGQFLSRKILFRSSWRCMNFYFQHARIFLLGLLLCIIFFPFKAVLKLFSVIANPPKSKM